MATEWGGIDASYDDQLFELYTKYVSEPESKHDVYGYSLLVVGLVLALGGLVVEFLLLTGVVLALFGVVLLVPVTRRSLQVGVGGAALGILAVLLGMVTNPASLTGGAVLHSTLVAVLYTVSVVTVAGVVILVPVLTGERSYFAERTGDTEYRQPNIVVDESGDEGQFLLFKDGGEWTWRFVDQSAVATGTSSTLSRLEAKERVEDVKAQVASATLLDIDDAAFRLYESSTGNWEWYLMRDDGSAVAEGTVTYDTQGGAETSLATIKDHSRTAEVFHIDSAYYDLQPSNDGWNWRLVHQDRYPLARGVEEHVDRDDGVDALEEFRDLAAEATELVVENYGIEIRETDGNWGWRLRDGAHRHLASSVTEYGSREGVEESVETLLERLYSAEVLEKGEPTYDVYKSESDWQWRLRDGSGTTVATGNTDVTGRERAAEAAEEMRAQAARADIIRIETLEFETHRTDAGWTWRLIDEDRTVHAQGPETYKSQQGARSAVDRVREAIPDAELLEFDNAAFHVYEADDGIWRWRLIDEDGAELANSAQGEYNSKDSAMHTMTTLQENAPDAETLEIETAAFELFEDDDGWGWRLVDEVGQTIADGATRHGTEDDARAAMETVAGTVSDIDQRRMSSGVFQIFTEGNNEWWWEFVLPDGSVLADAPERFESRGAVEAEIDRIRQDAGTAPVKMLGHLGVLLDPDDWSWLLVDEHREPIAVSEKSYRNGRSAVDAITNIKSEATETTVYEIERAAFDYYRNDEGWTWRLIDEDHETVAHATQTYDDLQSLRAGLEFVTDVAPDAEFLDYEDLGFELYQTASGWTWRLIDQDQQILATATNHYVRKGQAKEDIEAAKRDIVDASVMDIDAATFEFHHTDDGWRWRLVDETGDELAESLNTFSSRAQAEEELTKVMEIGPDALISHAQ